MTEAEWNHYPFPEPMLQFLGSKVTERKLRLFAAACCRRVWHLLTDERSRLAVEVAERYGDGLASRSERKTAAEAAHAARGTGSAAIAASFAIQKAARDLTANIMNIAGDTATLAVYAVENANGTVREVEYAAQAALVRDLFGNPFGPDSTIGPAVLDWNHGMVRRIALSIYDNREFDRLSLLHSALARAGCDNDELLAHLRSEGPHVRGCWALDLVLGRS